MVSINFVRYRLATLTGDDIMSCSSSDMKYDDSAVMILLNMSREKKVRKTMESSFAARISPSPAMPVRYVRTR